jgi:tryptophan synthase alpha chain
MSDARAMRRSIGETFGQLREQRRVGLMPFIPAGYPDLATTAAVLPALEAGGANVIEIGFPFSDPIADGPTIQAAFTEALAKKLKVSEVFATVAAVRDRVSVPLVAMISYSIVFRFGVERFVAAAKSAGLDGLILPDLPPPEAQRICEMVRAGGLDTILLVAPTTAKERRAEIARLCSGFIYYLSVSGITGEREKLPADLANNLREMRSVTDKPLCVGFGIHRREQVQQLAGLAEGVIVGTAVVKRMQQHIHEGPAAIARAVEQYVRELTRTNDE